MMFFFIGAMHDKSALEFSPLFTNYLNGLPADTVVLGDAAYRGFHPKVVVPYTGVLDRDQGLLNERHSAMRQIVERSIGALQTKWRILQMKENRLPAKSSVRYASKCIVACCVLHNRFTNFVVNDRAELDAL